MVQFILLALAASVSQDLDDTRLARQIKAGDHEAFKAFFERHHIALFRFLISKGISNEAAEDLVQQAFVYIWEHRGRIDESKSLRSYLFTMGYTRMLNHIRDHKKNDAADPNPTLSSVHTPETEVRGTQLREAIDQAIQAMPDRRRMVFDLCFLQEFTYQETAEALDISIKTVEKHMGLALKDMRSALDHFI